MIRAETKATSQHQVTIPKPIWDEAHLKPGARFKVELRDPQTIVLEVKADDLDLSEEEWKKLVRLAKDERNVSRRFKDSKSARAHLRRL